MHRPAGFWSKLCLKRWQLRLSNASTQPTHADTSEIAALMYVECLKFSQLAHDIKHRKMVLDGGLHFSLRNLFRKINKNKIRKKVFALELMSLHSACIDRLF